MGSSLLTGSTFLGMTGILGLFSDWAVRATLILLAVFGIAALMRRAAAASRHVVWATGLVSVLVVPILAVALPWRLNVLPSWGRTEAPASAFTAPAPLELLDRGSVNGPASTTPITPSEASSEAPVLAPFLPPAAMSAPSAAATGGVGRGFRPTALQIVIAVWAAVAVGVTLRLFLGLLLAWRLTQRARPMDDSSWAASLRWASERLGVKAPIRLLATDDLLIPVTSGLARPVIMLPESARSWSEERRRAVLLHETAHVKRWDWVTQLMAHTVCALHWFNPLCWIAAKRLRADCERACDDLVLDAGTQASRYAEHLLQIVRAAGRVRAPAGALPLAQRSEFEGRLLAILEPRLEQRRMKPLAAAFIAVLVLGLSLPLAAMAPRYDTGPVQSTDEVDVADDMNVPSENDGTGLSLSVMRNPASPLRSDSRAEADAALSDQPITVSLALESASQGRNSERLNALLVALSDSDAEVRAAALGSIGQLVDGEEVAVDSVQVAALLRALRTDPEPEVRRMAAWALGELEDARAVQALGEALRQDQDSKVRATAAWALGEIESPEAVAALGAALQDDDVEVRRMAIRALGEIESPNAVDVLIPALRDSDAEIRKYAAWALGEIEDARAVDGLGVALRDQDSEVRRAAVHALGEIESPAALDALLPALQDSEFEVRRHAAWALGEIEDARAVDALGGALSDNNAEVRGAVVHALGNIESPKAVDYLLPMLQDSDAEVRKRAAWALGEIEDPRAAEPLGAALRDEDVEVRRAAIYALGEIESPMSVDALLPALQDSDVKIRKHAAWALGEIEDPRAADALVAALGDDDAEVRRAVIHGLGELDLTQAPGPLMDALQDVDPQVRQAAAHALSDIGDPMAVPALTAALQDEDVKVRRAALHALVDMPNEAAVNALLEALKDDDPQVRKTAAQALGKHD